MAVQHNIIIGQSKSKPLYIDIFTPDKGGDFETVVFLHGTKGFKDWGAWQRMAPFFNHAGFALVLVNFSHNGLGPQNPTEFIDPEAYGQNTVSLELSEINMVLNWLQENAESWNLRSQAFNLIGHSRAGGEVLVYANRDKRVDKVICWAPIKDFLEVYKNVDKDQWKADGVIETLNSRTGEHLPVKYDFVTDIEKNLPEFDIIAAAALLEKPLLLIHGEKDESVSLASSEAIYENCLHALLVTIPEAGHTFGITHPWPQEKALPAEFVQVLENTIEFITG